MNDTRHMLEISGPDRVHFLQGILTQDVEKLAADKIQFAALLSPQGKILHDMFLIDAGESILLDSAAELAPTLRKRLMMYKLRAKVEIGDRVWGIGYSETLFPDPRHPDLPSRDYSTTIGKPSIPHTLNPIPSLGHDFAPDTLTALDAGYDLLHAVSFTKGCYVGQEITARMHYKSIARRGWFVLERDGMPPRLANLKFDEVFPENSPVTGHASPATISVDNFKWHAHVPEWMQPKLRQFESSRQNQS
ncbi:MAG: YgfZ/GcvT domain-containing protein [Rickettsiales bacterium]